jgi:hypothetical protein
MTWRGRGVKVLVDAHWYLARFGAVKAWMAGLKPGHDGWGAGFSNARRIEVFLVTFFSKKVTSSFLLTQKFCGSENLRENFQRLIGRRLIRCPLVIIIIAKRGLQL